MSWAFFADILRVGGVGSLSTLQTTLTVALTTGLVGAAAGPEAVAGYGTGARLEYLLIPLVFGLGAPLVAMVGTNIGAGQNAARVAHRHDRRSARLRRDRGDRSRRRDLACGVAQPVRRRSDDARDRHDLSALRRPDLRVLRPGPRRSISPRRARASCIWPLLAGFVRLVIAVGGGWLALTATGSLTFVFAMLGAALAIYGAIVGVAIWSGVWFKNGAAVAR